MDGMKSDKIRLVVAPHPFKTDKIVKDVERATFRELFTEYVETSLDIDYAVIIDGDKKVTDLDYTPVSDYVLIRMVPQGDGSNSRELRQAGTGSKIAGGALIVLGIIALLTPAAALGAPLIISGVTTLIGGVVLYNTDIGGLDDYKEKESKVNRSVRGSRNQTALNGMIPILLGRHRIYPYNAALPYTSSDLAGASPSPLNVGIWIYETSVPYLYVSRGYLGWFSRNTTVTAVGLFDSSDSAVVVDSEVLIDNPEHLRYRIYFDRDVIAPLSPPPVTHTRIVSNKYLRNITANSFRGSDLTGRIDKGDVIRISGTDYTVTNTASRSGYNDDVIYVTPAPSFSTGSYNIDRRIVPRADFVLSVQRAGDETIQYLHQLFCPGYKDMVIHDDTYKIGDVTINDASRIQIDASTDTTDTSLPVMYDRRVIENGWNEKMIWVAGETAIEHKTVSSNGTYEISYTITFPRGLVRYDNSGNPSANGVSFRVSIGHYDTDTFFYSQDLTISTTREENFRRSYVYTLDNTDPTDTEYNDRRQYRIQFERLTVQSTDNNVIDDTYIESVRSLTARFQETLGVWSYNADPIVEDIRDQVAYIGVQVKADDNYNEVLDTFNFEATLIYNIFDSSTTGPTAWQEKETTSNPASCFLYILTSPNANPHYIPEVDWETYIDFESLEEWYDYCDRLKLFCNVYITDSPTIEEVLYSICRTGFASWSLIDGKYTIIIDTYRTVDREPDLPDGSNALIIQYFTPRNSHSFSGSKGFGEENTVLKTAYIDADLGYVDNVLDVFLDDPDPGEQGDFTSPRSINTWGVTFADQAYKLGKYELAVARLRPEIFSFSTDIEYLVCTRGDRVQLTHDVPLFGITSGRIVNIIDDGFQINGAIVDENFIFENGKTYAVTIRLQDGGRSQLELINPSVGDVVETTTIAFSSPPPVGTFDIEDLIMFGESGSETHDLIVLKIEPSNDIGATITCADYAPEIFESIFGEIPEYNPELTLPADLGEVVPVRNYDPQTQLNDLYKVSVSVSGSALTAVRPDSAEIQAGTHVNACIVGTGQVVYVDVSDERHQYIKYPVLDLPSRKLTAVPTGEIAWVGEDGSGDDRIVYRNLNDDKLYVKSIYDGGIGTQVTESSATSPSYIAGDDIAYINVEDGQKIYTTSLNDTTDGTALTDFGVLDLDVYGATTIAYVALDGDPYIYTKPFDNTVGNLLVDVPASSPKFDFNGNFFYANLDEDHYIYFKEIQDESNGVPIFLSGLPLDTDEAGNMLYVSLINASLYYAPIDVAIKEAEIESQPVTNTLIGDFEVGSDIISNISATDLQEMGKGDDVFSSNLPDDTATILFRGPTFIQVDKLAESTEVGAELIVVGRRIILDAGRVIVPGTISADLLEATAIYSKATTDDESRSISEINLDDGTMQIRKPDNTVVLDFDPNRTDEELKLQGSMQSANYDPGVAGWNIDESGDAQFNNILTKGIVIADDGSFSGAVDGVIGDSVVYSTTIQLHTGDSFSTVKTALENGVYMNTTTSGVIGYCICGFLYSTDAYITNVVINNNTSQISANILDNTIEIIPAGGSLLENLDVYVQERVSFSPRRASFCYCTTRGHAALLGQSLIRRFPNSTDIISEGFLVNGYVLVHVTSPVVFQVRRGIVSFMVTGTASSFLMEITTESGYVYTFTETDIGSSTTIKDGEGNYSPMSIYI